MFAPRLAATRSSSASWIDAHTPAGAVAGDPHEFGPYLPASARASSARLAAEEPSSAKTSVAIPATTVTPAPEIRATVRAFDPPPRPSAVAGVGSAPAAAAVVAAPGLAGAGSSWRTTFWCSPRAMGKLEEEVRYPSRAASIV